MNTFGDKPAQDFVPCLSRPRLAIVGAAVAVTLLAACGSGEKDPGVAMREFTSQVREDIQATKRVGEAVRFAEGPLDIQHPYETYGEEMAIAKEQLRALEPAPTECLAAAEEYALSLIGPLSRAGETFNQRDYTPALLENAKRGPAEQIEKLKGSISEARC